MSRLITRLGQKREPLLVAAINAVSAALIYVAVTGRFYVSMSAVALIVTSLIYLERVGLVDELFRLYSSNRRAALLTLSVILFLFPFTIRKSPYLVHIAVMACLYAITAMGLNFQMGSTDMTNFAGGAFFGMGAYTSALLNMKTGISPWLGIPAALVMTVLLAYLIGLPTLRTKGYYLSLVTIAMQTMFTLLIINTDWVGGPNGVAGITPFSLGSYSFRSPLWLFGYRLPYQAHYFYLSAVVLLCAGYVASRLHTSRVGLCWNTIGEDEIAARCQGINPASAKLLAFCAGGAFAGVAGAIYAHYISFIGPEDFDFTKSLMIICMVILGGMDNVTGVTVGAVLLTLIDEKLRDFTDYRMLLYGVILLTVLLLRPEGLIPKRVRRYELLLGRTWRTERGPGRHETGYQA